MSGETLRCDVIIDSITRLEIVTTTRELYVEEAPEEFEVRAYDDQGNEFSSLDGLEFEWQLEDVTELESVVSAQNVLRFMRFTDSPYKTPPFIAELEQRGKQGAKVLIEGRQTGTGRLKVSIPHPAYKSVPPDEVTLMVVANLLLEPQDVYVLPGTAVEYSVLHLKHGILHPVPLHNSHYYLQVQNRSVGELQNDGISVISQELGQTKVILFDHNVKSSESIKQPTANYHVVEPGYLTIEVAPGNKPHLIVGRNNAFHVHVYDTFNNRIFLADNIAINTTVPESFFTSQDTNENGTFVYGVPVKEGKMTVTALLSEILVGNEVLPIAPPLKASLDVLIFSQIHVTPKLTVLPYDPISLQQHSFDLVAVGGSGHVLWSSSDTDLANIVSSGRVTTYSFGRSVMTGAMAQNPENYDTADVIVLEVLSLFLVEKDQEGIVGDVIEVGIGASGASGEMTEDAQSFTQCHMLPFSISDLGHDFVSLPDIRPKVLPGSCATLDVIGKKPGFSSVQVSYSLESGKELAVNTHIGAYFPLKVMSPESGESVLGPHTGRVIQFKGGPLPWILKPSNHYAEVSIDDENIITAHLLPSSDSSSGIFEVFVECQELGQAKVTLTVGNHASKTLPKPKKSTSSAVVICSLPDSVSLSVFSEQPVKGVPPCPLSSQPQSSAIASCEAPVPLLVTVRNGDGRKLDNISSLSFEWSSDGNQLATLPENGFLINDDSIGEYGLLAPAGAPGEMNVKVFLRPFSDGASLIVSTKLHLKLVKFAVLEPSILVLYNHPDSKGNITINGGSGYFMLAPSEEKVAKLKYDTPQNVISAQPIVDGTHAIKLLDLCLHAHHAESAVRVASMGSVKISVTERLEFGGFAYATLTLLDSFGLLLPIQASIMSPSLSPQNDIISTTFVNITETGEALYLVKGLKIGDTNLRGSVAPKNGDVTQRLLSARAPIQVYPALHLEPKIIILVVGSMYQITASGGPYPDGRIEFYATNETVCDVAAVSGLVTASVVGTTTVHARAVLQNQPEEENALQSKNAVTVHVIPIISIEIEAPTAHLETGTSMPAYVMGRGFGDVVGAKLTPLSFASAQPAILFDWTSSNKQVATLSHLFANNDIKTNNVNNAIIQIAAHRPGDTTISVTASVVSKATEAHKMQIQANAVLKATFKLNVFESLIFKKPPAPHARLLLSPGAQYQLATSRDTDTQMSFSLSGCTKDDSLVSVSSNGEVKATHQTGDATVLVTSTEENGVVQSAALLVQVCLLLVFSGLV